VFAVESGTNGGISPDPFEVHPLVSLSFVLLSQSVQAKYRGLESFEYEVLDSHFVEEPVASELVQRTSPFLQRFKPAQDNQHRIRDFERREVGGL
jgi:hypothetical protein